MKKTGRPNGRPRLPEGEGKSYPIQVRLSKKERELVKIVAETYGIPVSSWARIVILKAANKRLSPRA